MNEPTFDAEDYPTEETLERIATWEIITNADCEAAMDFAGAAWKYDAWQKERNWSDALWPNPQVRYVFSTCGWSGNESIVAAIEKNMILQMIGAWSWRRGGHYEYRFPMDYDMRKEREET